jgi:hypothetical protein
VLRLTGLPSVSSAPEVRVERTQTAVVLWFLGAPGAPPLRRVDVPVRLVGEEIDAETAQLDLLAWLGQLGYAAAPVSPRDFRSP